MLAIRQDFESTLQKLEKLSRNHLLFFRVEVGKLLLDQFFDGEAAAYQSHDPTKPQRFKEFTDACIDQLSDIGLGEQVLRQCLVAHIVVKTLPHATVVKLGFSQVIELTRVPDPATRRVLAQATVENGWTARQLKGAADAVKAGKWIDGDPGRPGLQAPLPTDLQEPAAGQVKVLPAARVVSRFEKAVEEFDTLALHWEAVSGEKLTEVQKGRVKKALAELEERVGKVKAGLG